MQQLQLVLRTMCNRVGSLVALKVRILADAGEWGQIQDLSLDPCSYQDADEYWADAMCVDLVRKAVLPGRKHATALAAVDSFLETERTCYAVNREIRTLSGKMHNASDRAFYNFLSLWSVKIRRVMGKVPEVLDPKFSSGSSTSTTMLWSTTLDKLSTTPQYYGGSHCEYSLWWYYTSAWGKIAGERGLAATPALGNEFFTVPKSGKTDRPACKEATINCVLQLAVGSHLRSRLLTQLGIDLNHGQLTHQELAREGSLTDGIATLDMSSASDRWARELVLWLVSSEWAELLSGLRAKHTMFGNKRLWLEKFSSMGNGFTFELETVLFATLAQTVAELEGLARDDVLCYGDDLIVPALLAEPLMRALERVGHKPNMRKSYWSGPFRESCGGDYHSGKAVSTVKLEQFPKEPQQWMSLANNLRRVAGESEWRWALVRPVWEKVLAFIPNHIRQCRGPTHLGDQVIHDSERHWPSTKPGFVRVYRPVAAKRPISDYGSDGLAVIIASTLSQEPISSGIPLRKVEGYVMRWAWRYQASTWLPGVRPVRKRPTPLLRNVETDLRIWPDYNPVYGDGSWLPLT